MIDSSYETIEKQMSGLLPEGTSGTDWRLFRYSPGESVPNEYPDIEAISLREHTVWMIRENEIENKQKSKTQAAISKAEGHLRSAGNKIATIKKRLSREGFDRKKIKDDIRKAQNLVFLQ